jgi:hypothetical protein
VVRNGGVIGSTHPGSINHKYVGVSPNGRKFSLVLSDSDE